MMHWNHVRGAAYLPDGRSAVSAGNDGIIRFWDVDTGRNDSKSTWADI